MLARQKSCCFPKDEFEQRWRRAREEMELAELDALMLSQPENVYYFSGNITTSYYQEPILFVLCRDKEPIMLAPLREKGNIETSTWIDNIEVWGTEDPEKALEVDKVEVIGKTLKRLALDKARIGTELKGRRSLLSEDLSKIRQKMPESNFSDASRITERIRMIKSEREIVFIKRAIEITSTAFKIGMEALQDGVTEKEIAQVIWMTMLEHGGDLPPYAGHLVLRGGPERNKCIHSMPLDKKLVRGDIIKIDGGCRYHGYLCDFARFAAIGTPTEEQLRLFKADYAANRACIDAAKVGATTTTVYRAGMDALAQAGFGDLKLSAGEIFGHSIGLETHEYPMIQPTPEVELQPGMVLSVEPQLRAYPPDYKVSMFNLEDMVLISEEGPKELTSLDRDLWIV